MRWACTLALWLVIAVCFKAVEIEIQRVFGPEDPGGVYNHPASFTVTKIRDDGPGDPLPKRLEG